MARTETHYLAGTSGRGCRHDVSIRTSSTARREPGSAFTVTHYAKSRLPRRSSTTASFNDGSSRHAPHLQAEPRREPAADPQGSYGMQAVLRAHSNTAAKDKGPRDPAARNGSSLGNGRDSHHTDAAANGARRDRDPLYGSDDDRDAAQSRNSEWTAGAAASSAAEDGGSDTQYGSEEPSDVQDDDVAASSPPPDAAEADTSVLERVRSLRVGLEVRVRVRVRLTVRIGVKCKLRKWVETTHLRRCLR